MNITRRSFIKNLATGLLVAAAPELLLPQRKQWFVPRYAPVGSRVDDGMFVSPAWSLVSRKAPQPISPEVLRAANAWFRAMVQDGCDGAALPAGCIIENVGESPLFIGGCRILPGQAAWVGDCKA